MDTVAATVQATVGVAEVVAQGAVLAMGKVKDLVVAPASGMAQVQDDAEYGGGEGCGDGDGYGSGGCSGMHTDTSGGYGRGYGFGNGSAPGYGNGKGSGGEDTEW